MVAQGFRRKSRAIQEVPHLAAEGWELGGGIRSSKFAVGCFEDQISFEIAGVEPVLVESSGGSAAAFAWTRVMPDKIAGLGREVIRLVAGVGNVQALTVHGGRTIVSVFHRLCPYLRAVTLVKSVDCPAAAGSSGVNQTMQGCRRG